MLTSIANTVRSAKDIQKAGSVDYHTGDTLTTGVEAPGDSPLYGANPYRDATYKVGAWDQFLNWLGFRSNADAWKENMAIQAREYDSAITQQLRNEDYESPANQVARMRAAGLNPDLNGGQGISSGSAMPGEPDPSIPDSSEADNGEGLLHQTVSTIGTAASSLAKGVITAFSSAMNMVSGFQGIIGKSIDNRLGSIGEAKDLTTLVKQMVDDMATRPVSGANPEDSGYTDFSSTVDSQIEMMAQMLGLRKRHTRAMSNYAYDYAQSLGFDIKRYGAAAERIDARTNFWRKRTSKLYNEGDKEMMVITSGLNDISDDAYRTMLEAQKYEAQNALDYQKDFNGSLEASADNSTNQKTVDYNESFDAKVSGAADNATNRLRQLQQSFLENSRKSLKEMRSKLMSEGKLGQAAALFLTGLELQLFDGVSFPSIPLPQRKQKPGISVTEKYGAGGEFKGVTRSFIEK